MSQHHSRKQFFAKSLGLIAAAGLAPKLLAQPASASATKAPGSTPARLQIRSDARTVARAGDSV